MLKIDSQYYLVINSVLGVDGEQRILKLNNHFLMMLSLEKDLHL